MKTVKFKPSLVPSVLSGEKKSTWRLFDDKDLQVGDVLSLINKETLEPFGTARITSVIEKKMKDLQESDFDGHEKYESDEKMYEAYRSYYGDRVTTDSVVKMITFELLP